MGVPDVLWIMNGCGLDSRMSGGPFRCCEILRRWQCTGRVSQRMLTTPGGAGLLAAAQVPVAPMVVPASLWARREVSRLLRVWSYGISARAACRYVRRLPPGEVVITASDYFCDVLPAREVKRRWAGCRWVAWVHHKELPPSERPGNRLVNTFTRSMQERSFKRIARLADEAWVYDTDAGDLVRARLLALGMPEARVRRMLCGVDLAAIRVAPEPARKTVDAVMIGVRPNKGMHDIIPIWEQVQRLRPGTTLRLMGGISGEQATLAEIRRRGLDRVIEVFRPTGGYLAPAAYYAKLKEARTLFAPSHEEGWGIMICEAMAGGLPAVAYDLPVYHRIYGSALRAVPRFDHAAFAAALVEVLNEPARFAELVRAGHACASRYSWDALAMSDGEALERLVAQAAR